jgi:hypothetical protein
VDGGLLQGCPHSLKRGIHGAGIVFTAITAGS